VTKFCHDGAGASRSTREIEIKSGIGLLVGLAFAIASYGQSDTGLVKDLICDSLRDEAIQKILQNRANLINELTGVVNENTIESSKNAAIYVLGELRAAEACELLVANIGIGAMPVIKEIPRFGAVPAASALIKIGNPCIPCVMAKIKETDDKWVRKRLTTVLFKVTGNVETNRLLAAELKANPDPKVAGRLKEAIKGQ